MRFFFVNKQKKINEKENIDKRRCVVVMDQIPENEFLFSQQWVWGKSFFCLFDIGVFDDFSK